MDLNPKEYILDFTIPQGPTGPTGSSNIEAIFTASYQPMTQVGNLSFSANTILPADTRFFRIQSNQIIIEQEGFYEISFSGLLKEETTALGATIVLNINGISLTSISLLPNVKQIYFLQPCIERLDATTAITVSLQKQDVSDASAENVYVILKKLVPLAT